VGYNGKLHKGDYIMLRVYDVECRKCGHIEEQYTEDDTDFTDCEKCGGVMNRIYTKFNYKLIYNNKTDMCS
jgi:predicted nucleic acid-binding Zn ribbon protein